MRQAGVRRRAVVNETSRKRVQPLFEGLEPRQLLAAQVYDGALNGKIIYLTGGHGINATAGVDGTWNTDRGVNNGLVEDYGNQEQLQPFADYILRAGGTVAALRPIGHQANEVVVDNDSPGVTLTGSWAIPTGTIFYDEDFGATPDTQGFRFANVNANETATAVYTPTISQAGFYPVYTWASAGTNRALQLYHVNHSGGTTDVKVDHRNVGNGWVYLGTYHFNAGNGGNVTISNKSPSGTVVIADAIRFGNGVGDWDPGTGLSGRAREDEAALYWILRGKGEGVAASVYDTGDDGDANIGAQPEFAAAMNRAPFGQALYISFHSNAAGATARGAVGLTNADNGSGNTPNQTRLATLLGKEVNEDMRAVGGTPTLEYAWSGRTDYIYDDGPIDYGEISSGNTGNEFDATIVEVGFHTNVEDTALMKSAVGRDYLGRATYHGIVRYFNQFGGSALQFAPSTPTNVRATASAGGDVTVAWSAPPADAVNANRDVNTGANGYAAAAYNVYVSRNGYGFELLGSTASTSFTVPAATLDGNAYYFRVAATNVGGESPASPVVGSRKNGSGGGGGTNRILVVNGFDRNDSTLSPTVSASINYNPPSAGTASTYTRVWRQHINTFDYVVQAGEAIEAFNGFGASLGFDSAQNENVANGQVNLANYQTVIWLAGEESTVHETFSTAEQNAVTSFLNAGGRLFVSGAEVGWDLDRASGPTAADRAFYNNVLRADHAADDGGSYTTAGVAGSIFDGVSLTFDNGATTYNAEAPDRLTALGGASLAMTYTGAGSGGAAIQYSAGPTGPRVVNMGFPFETITTAANRNAVMSRVLTFFETVASATPGAPDLVATSDTGSSNTDNRTRRDNSTSATPLQFVVPGTIAGAAVTLFADGVEIGSAVGTAGSTTVTTNGSTDLTDGARVITARQTESGKSASSPSASLAVTVDTVRPTVQVTAVTPDPRTTPVESIGIVFSERVNSFVLGDLTLTRASDGTGADLLTASQTLTSADAITFTLGNLTALTSKTGTYSMAVTPFVGKVIADDAGNALASTANDTWVHSLPSWLTADSVATWDAATKALTVTGATTITSDPGADAPLVTASGAAAVLTIDTAPGTVAGLRGLHLSNGAAATVAPAGAERILVVSDGAQLTLDATATLDLTDNALVIRNASQSAATASHASVNNLVRSAFNDFGWDGPGITSSTAAADVANGLPSTLGILLNNDGGGNALFYGAGTEQPTFMGAPVDSNSVMLRFTRLGDGDLNGTVDSVDFALFQAGYTGAAPYIGFAFGDYDFNGVIDSVDFGLFQAGSA